MSRIEMAMEKAAMLRQGLEEAVPVPVEPAPAPAASNRRSTPPVTVAGQGLAPKHSFLVDLHDPRSPVAEEYRKLKSALVKITKGDDFNNAIMVTSSLPNEGKSLTALNLAITLAREIDHTVLLIDADLRRPSLHRYLEMEQGKGLADLLAGEAEVAETIVPTGIGKLSIMRAGRQVDNPAELFSSQRMKELVEEMKHRYPDRYLIFDTPPVLPFAETRSLAHMVDGVLFVVRERLAVQASIRDALDCLKGCGMLGVIYNAVASCSGDDRYSYYRDYRKI